MSQNNISKHFISSLTIPEKNIFWITVRKQLNQHMRFWNWSHLRAVRAKASLCTCTVLQEPSLLAFTKKGIRNGLRLKIKPLIPLNSCACIFIDGLFAYAITVNLKKKFEDFFIWETSHMQSFPQ